ncbi:fecCD transport family protein, partial [Vibrio parahaemolyticus VPTS-2010]
CRVGW